MRRIVPIVVLVLVLLTGCTTVKYVYPKMPEYTAKIPARPTLEKTSGEVPAEVNRNTIKLISYIEQLEITLDSFQTYYDNLRELWSGNDADDR